MPRPVPVSVLAACLVACGGSACGSPSPAERVAEPSSEATAVPAPPVPPPRSEGPRPPPCTELTRTACMGSAECVLVLIDPEGTESYACRPSQGRCEEGLPQADLPDEPGRCDAREGCTYRPPQCYCHCRGDGRTAVPDGEEAEDCDCECAGGLPPACVPDEAPEPG